MDEVDRAVKAQGHYQIKGRGVRVGATCTKSAYARHHRNVSLPPLLDQKGYNKGSHRLAETVRIDDPVEQPSSRTTRYRHWPWARFRIRLLVGGSVDAVFREVLFEDPGFFGQCIARNDS